MKWRVRTPDGELEFQSFGQLERAYWDGLVDPHDDICEEGERWRKAGTHPHLAEHRRPVRTAERHAQIGAVSLAVGVGSVCLWALTNGRYAVGAISGALTVAVVWRITYRASQRRRTGAKR
ncbi:MAG: hypothetical protein ACKVPX_11570 [Myxococcaceae bacterium]